MSQLIIAQAHTLHHESNDCLLLRAGCFVLAAYDMLWCASSVMLQVVPRWHALSEDCIIAAAGFACDVGAALELLGECSDHMPSC